MSLYQDSEYVYAAGDYLEGKQVKYRTLEERARLQEASQKKMEEFVQCIVDHVQFNQGVRVRLLGDLLADRGYCDWMTLKILSLAKDQGVECDITLSNHDLGFFQHEILDSDQMDPKRYIQIDNENYICAANGGSCDSLMGLRAYTNNDAQKINEYKLMVEKIIPMYKLISYDLVQSQNGNKINLYMHGVNDEFIITKLAQELGVSLPVNVDVANASAEELADIIDNINHAFQRIMADPKWRKNFVASIDAEPYILGTTTKREYTALENLLLRYTEGYKEKNQRNPNVAKIVHGHSSGAQEPHGIVTLDEDFGKAKDAYSGKHLHAISAGITHADRIDHKINLMLDVIKDKIDEAYQKLMRLMDGADLAHQLVLPEQLLPYIKSLHNHMIFVCDLENQMSKGFPGKSAAFIKVRSSGDELLKQIGNCQVNLIEQGRRIKTLITQTGFSGAIASLLSLEESVLPPTTLAFKDLIKLHQLAIQHCRSLGDGLKQACKKNPGDAAYLELQLLVETIFRSHDIQLDDINTFVQLQSSTITPSDKNEAELEYKHDMK